MAGSRQETSLGMITIRRTLYGNFLDLGTLIRVRLIKDLHPGNP